MHLCPIHNTKMVYRSGTNEKGPWGRYSCPRKDNDAFCKEGVWARPPAEEMVNLLADIAASVRRG